MRIYTESHVDTYNYHIHMAFYYRSPFLFHYKIFSKPGSNFLQLFEGKSCVFHDLGDWLIVLDHYFSFYNTVLLDAFFNAFLRQIVAFLADIGFT